LSKIEKIDQNSTKTTTNFLYDENGNLLKDASHEYIYDKKARLVGVDNNVSYAYNHENTRVSKTINAETTHFIYDGAKLIGEYNSDGSVKNEYIYLDNIPVGVIPRGYPQDGVKYILPDHLGTPRRLADENGNIVWSWESEPFGESKAVGSVEFNLRFAGQYFDVETSTHYNINRDYNPKTGRYLQSDPIGFDGGVNSYGYVAGNPLVRIDPCGLNYFKAASAAAIFLAKKCTQNNKTCKEKACNSLNFLMHRACDEGNSPCKTTDSTIILDSKLLAKDTCLYMRESVRICFGANDDPNKKGHAIAIANVKKGIQNCQKILGRR